MFIHTFCLYMGGVERVNEGSKYFTANPWIIYASIPSLEVSVITLAHKTCLYFRLFFLGAIGVHCHEYPQYFLY